MSKRCELQKEYYKKYGSYKGDGKYSDHYVKWLEEQILELRLCSVVEKIDHSEKIKTLSWIKIIQEDKEKTVYLDTKQNKIITSYNDET